MEVLPQAAALLAALTVCALTTNALVSCLALGGCAAFMLAVSLAARLSKDRQIEALTAYLMRVQDSLELPAPEREPPFLLSYTVWKDNTVFILAV